MASPDHTTPDLIPFMARQVGTETVNTVNARDLYAYLEIKGDYSLWIRRAIKRANLIEQIDFIVFYHQVENPKGGRPGLEHHLTFDAAKHIAMMSSMEKGHEIRVYFIATEKAHQAKTLPPQVRDPAIQMIIDMAVHLDEARTLAAEAKQLAMVAETKAEMATQGQAWLTIHQYVILHHLERQMPASLQVDYGRYLTGYCAEKGLRVYPQPVAYQRWSEEHAYYVEAIHETLPAWLTRRHAQPELHVLTPREG